MRYTRLRNVVLRYVIQVAGITASAVAAAATGDLDPSFADHGRLNTIPGASGTARTIELLEASSFVVGGGSFSFSQSTFENPRSCRTSVTNFLMQLGESGAIDWAAGSAALAKFETIAIARQLDGGLIAVGRQFDGPLTRCGPSPWLAVSRFNNDGLVDQTFGSLGIFRLSTKGQGSASSVVIEPDGRIAVAGTVFIPVGDTYESRFIMLRLLANGSPDPNFGEEGVFIGFAVNLYQEVRLLRTVSGTYRVVVDGTKNCVVVGVTADGVLDTDFPSDGIRRVLSNQGNPVNCASADPGPDGSLLLAGSEVLTDDGGSSHLRGFAQRLLADGARDPAFSADETIAETLTRASSIAFGVDGTVLIAGSSADRGSILRLKESGVLDPAFGHEGRTWIDLPTDSDGVPIVHDMAVRTDGSVIAVGGNGEPFVLRLLGTGGGVSPGILTFSTSTAKARESEAALVSVRRTGGSDGPVSVDFRTVADLDATAGLDFVSTSGTLEWEDGDISEREIEIPIIQDEGTPEAFEKFMVTLEGPLGDAGLGREHVTVTITPDGAPAGQISFYSAQATWSERGIGQFWIDRRYYSEGAVCVTVTPKSGSAIAGMDFEGDATTVCWNDEDSESKLVEIQFIDDDDLEDPGEFSIGLSSPTGGAIIGPQDVMTITLHDNEVVVTPPPRRGGGGPAGAAELLLLALLAAGRGCRRRFQCVSVRHLAFARE